MKELFTSFYCDICNNKSIREVRYVGQVTDAMWNTHDITIGGDYYSAMQLSIRSPQWRWEIHKTYRNMSTGYLLLPSGIFHYDNQHTDDDGCLIPLEPVQDLKAEQFNFLLSLTI